MKPILLLLGLNLWYTCICAQGNNKDKPQESRLLSNDTGKIARNEKSDSQLTRGGANALPIGMLKVVRNDSVFIYKRDSLIVRRSIKAPAHKLEDQLPVESPLTENEDPSGTPKKNSAKPEKPIKP